MKKLHEIDQVVVNHLGFMPPPVEIDKLVNLTGFPMVALLNAMERIKKKKIVYEKKSTGKGVYFFSDKTRNHIVDNIQPHEKNEVITKLIQYFIDSTEDSDEKKVALADLYYNMKDISGGLHYIKSAGDIHLGSGQTEKALRYYNAILEYFRYHEPVPENVTIYIDTIPSIISIPMNLMTIEKRLSLLDKAEKAAKLHGQWFQLAIIEFHKARILIISEDLKKASSVLVDFRRLSRKLSNPKISRMVALVESELLFFQGKISEAAKCYENAIGNLEEFGDEEITLKMSALVGWIYVISGRIARGMGLINAVRDKCVRSGFLNTSVFADLMKIHCYLEIRKVNEAESVLNRIIQNKVGLDSKFALWAVNRCNAFIQYSKKRYGETFSLFTKGNEHLIPLGWPIRLNAWCLESLHAVHTHYSGEHKFDIDEVIDGLLDTDDIYTKGFALRYRAFRDKEKGEPGASILANLKESEAYLLKAGAEIELARTRMALADYFRQNDDVTESKSYLEKAWEFFSNVDKEMIPDDLMVIMPIKERTDFILNRIAGIAECLGSVHEISLFIEKALTVIMDFTLAMRGAVFVFDSGKPRIIASRNVDLKFADKDYFHTVKNILLEMEKNNIQMLFPGSDEGNIAIEKKIEKAGLNSFICMPAKLGDTNYAYLYLDNRFGDTAFPLDSLPFLRMICTQIAIGISNISIYNEVKELKERYESEAVFYRQEMRGTGDPTESIIGQAEETRKVIDQVKQVAGIDSTVLILGETGVGKGLVAKTIHNQSPRRDGPFISINLSVLPSELVASELFGHEKGAFTGANDMRRGRFELANGGSIFLDEIGDLPANIQVKLLEVLEDGCFERLGGRKKIRSDFRVLAATNKNLITEVEKGAFRKDLFFRLNVFPINIAPLRERKEDIPVLAHHFVEKYGRKMNKKMERISKNEMRKLLNYRWPGNIRELMHTIERAIILSENSQFRLTENEDKFAFQSAGETAAFLPLDDFEREYIIRVLQATGWKVNGENGAAMILGRKPSTLFSRMKKLGINRPSLAKNKKR